MTNSAIPIQSFEYNGLFQSLKPSIVSMNLLEIQARAEVPEIKPDQIAVQSEYNIRMGFLNEAKTAFQAMSQLTVTFREKVTDDVVGRISIELAAQYTTQQPANDEFLKLFTHQNVPLNAWPYLRELVHNTMLRFGWVPLVLPPLFVMPQEETAKSSKPRSKKTKALEQPK